MGPEVRLVKPLALALMECGGASLRAGNGEGAIRKLRGGVESKPEFSLSLVINGAA